LGSELIVHVLRERCEQKEQADKKSLKKFKIIVDNCAYCVILYVQFKHCNKSEGLYANN